MYFDIATETEAYIGIDADLQLNQQECIDVHISLHADMCASAAMTSNKTWSLAVITCRIRFRFSSFGSWVHWSSADPGRGAMYIYIYIYIFTYIYIW